MSTDENRPPYVVFEKQEAEDRAASIAAGHYVAREFDVAIITRPGSRDNLVKDAKQWLAELREKSRKNEIPPTWYEAFAAAYKQWQEGESGEVTNGMPLAQWPALGKAQVKTLLAAGLRSVEDLAELPDQELQSIGTGAIGLKQKAKAWLLASTDTGKMAERFAKMESSLSELMELSKKQQTEIERLRAFEPKPTLAKI